MEAQRLLRLKSGDDLAEEFDHMAAPLGLADREIKVLRLIAARGRFEWYGDQRAGSLRIAAETAARAAGCSQHTWQRGADDLERRGLIVVGRQNRPWTYVVNWSRVEALEPAPISAAADPAASALFSTDQRASALFSTDQRASALFSTDQRASALISAHQHSPPNGSGETPRAPGLCRRLSLSSSTTKTKTLKTDELTVDEVAACWMQAVRALKPDAPLQTERKLQIYVQAAACLAMRGPGASWLVDACTITRRRAKQDKHAYLKGVLIRQWARWQTGREPADAAELAIARDDFRAALDDIELPDQAAFAATVRSLAAAKD